MEKASLSRPHICKGERVAKVLPLWREPSTWREAPVGPPQPLWLQRGWSAVDPKVNPPSHPWDGEASDHRFRMTRLDPYFPRLPALQAPKGPATLHP